ncbi:MAG TPA: NfeD family protein [Candidatus Saccharimonadales bacterium]|jgi:membrane protein implicated in regulation of membrane protease activity|nr:NfeD family protein [Candidatus Saccharimonadales bacterium]
MTWSDFYLLCFLVGFSLSVLSFLAGAVHLHLPFKGHLPFHGWHGVGGHLPTGHAGGPAANCQHPSHSHGGSHLSWFNASTMMVFLAWFGGIGYILATHSRLIGAVTMGFAIFAGLSAAWLVFKFMVKLMNEEGSHLKDEDYRHEGLVCTVTSPIRENGTGEVVFLQAGVRRSTGARSHDGKPVEKGAEVVIEKYENGIAYVHRWDDFTS